jgi:hypothetical protein
MKKIEMKRKEEMKRTFEVIELKETEKTFIVK